MISRSPMLQAFFFLTLMTVYLYLFVTRLCPESAGNGTSCRQVQKVKLFDLCHACRQELLSWAICCQWLRLAQNWSKHTCKLQASVATVRNCTRFFTYGRRALEDSQDGVLMAPVQHSPLASSRQSWHCSPPQPWHLLSKQLVTASSFESLPGSLGWRIEMNRVYNYMWLINAYSTPSSSSPPIIPNGHQTVNLSNLPQAELAKCSSKSTIQTMTKPPKTSKYIQMNYN
jgi:hypothetical protein